MSKRRKNRRHALHTDKKHVLGTGVLSARIVWQIILRRSRNILVYGSVTCLLLVLAWGIFRSSRSLFLEGSRFQLTTLTIVPAPNSESFVTHSTLPGLSGLECGRSIFSYNLQELDDTLTAMPEIKEISLVRRYPGTIEVTIEERPPVAKLVYQGKKFLIDAEGYSFRSHLAVSSLWERLPAIKPLYGHELPINETGYLTDTGLLRSLHLAVEWNNQKLSEQLNSIEVIDYHSLMVHTDTRAKLTFGYYEHERQVRDYKSILNHCNTTQQIVKTANLLPFKNIPVTFDKAPKRRRTISPIKTSPARFTPQEDVLMILEQG